MLRGLEADGLVIRTVYDQVPPKVVYDVQRAERPGSAICSRRCDWGLYWSGRTGARILAFERGTGESQPA